MNWAGTVPSLMEDQHMSEKERMSTDRSDIATPHQGRADQDIALDSHSFPYPPPAMSSDPKLDNITGGGEKPQFDAGEDP